jgi:hypothetical protein
LYLTKEKCGQLEELKLKDFPEMIYQIKEAMKNERVKHIKAGTYQIIIEFRGHSNSYKPKMVRARVG